VSLNQNTSSSFERTTASCSAPECSTAAARERRQLISVTGTYHRRLRMGPAATAATGVVLLVAAATMRDRSLLSGFGTVSAAPAVRSTQDPPAARSTTSHPASPSPVPTRPTAVAVGPAAPSQVTIPAIGVHAAATGTHHQLRAQCARQIRHNGWWANSAPVGAATGTVVVDGHVDSAAAGPGALFRLTDLHASDRIAITTPDGQQQDDRVIGRRVYAKANGLAADLFSSTGAPRLVLITCGGPFDRTTLSYLDNIVVFASLTNSDDQSSS
jgi:Sortase domain